VLFDCVALDLGLHRVQEVNEHKGEQAHHVLESVTQEHHPKLRAQVRDLGARLMALAVPEYLQVVVLTQLVQAVLATKVMYFAQVAPQEIGAFYWTIDAKGQALTRLEEVWGDMVLPLLQTQSFREPLGHLIGADYSAFERFDIVEDAPPEHVRHLVREWQPGEKYISADLRLIVDEHRGYADSKAVVGLQIADVITNATARALKGNLQYQGWRRLGALMLTPPRQHEVIRFIRINGPNRAWRPEPPYHRVLAHLRGSARSPLVMGSG
jgi:hypothetical protein